MISACTNYSFLCIIRLQKLKIYFFTFNLMTYDIDIIKYIKIYFFIFNLMNYDMDIIRKIHCQGKFRGWAL